MCVLVYGKQSIVKGDILAFIMKDEQGGLVSSWGGGIGNSRGQNLAKKIRDMETSV